MRLKERNRVVPKISGYVENIFAQATAKLCLVLSRCFTFFFKKNGNPGKSYSFDNLLNACTFKSDLKSFNMT